MQTKSYYVSILCRCRKKAVFGSILNFRMKSWKFEIFVYFECAREASFCLFWIVRETAFGCTAIFDSTIRGAYHKSREAGFATQDHAQARDSNAAQGNTQDMEATSANL